MLGRRLRFFAMVDPERGRDEMVRLDVKLKSHWRSCLAFANLQPW
jgi:hypothetical protein